MKEEGKEKKTRRWRKEKTSFYTDHLPLRNAERKNLTADDIGKKGPGDCLSGEIGVSLRTTEGREDIHTTTGKESLRRKFGDSGGRKGV